jgi:indolepyruvate ferredoxin oxidoreductase beta subunit
MERKIILAGIGGQGVIYATKILTQAALARGEQVLASENHGMSQRGGSVLAHIKIGGSEAPLIQRGTADALVAFDRTEAIRHLVFIRAGGCVTVNSADRLTPALEARLTELGVQLWTVAAEPIARQAGAPAATNLVVLGFAAAHGALGLTLDELAGAVRALGPAPAVERNLRALRDGAAQAEASRAPLPAA